jgi:hypothetical protein
LRKRGPTNELAIWFVNTFLKRQFDYRMDGHHLKRAKLLVNPDSDPVTGEAVKTYTVEEVKEALLALRDGTTTVTDYLPFSDWSRRENWRGPGQIRSLGILFTQTDGARPLIDALLEVPDPPLPYETQEYAEWVKKHGERAIKQGKWDGIFEWLVSEEPATCSRMDYEGLVKIVGDELAGESLEKWRQLRETAKRAQK